MTTQATASATPEVTDPLPSRNPQGIPFRVPTRPELIKYIGDYAYAYAVVEHRADAAMRKQNDALKAATQAMSTAIDYLYGRNTDLELLLHEAADFIDPDRDPPTSDRRDVVARLRAVRAGRASSGGPAND